METREQILQISRQLTRITQEATVVPIGGGFSGAQVWKIEDRGHHYALRRWPKEGAELARLQGLHRLLKYMWNTGIHEIAVPIGIDQQTLLWIGEQWWQLEPWMPGTADFHRNPNSDRLQAAMGALARWHGASMTFRGTVTDRHWFDVRQAPPVGLCERLSKFHIWQSTTARKTEALLHRQTGQTDFRLELTQILSLIQCLIPAIIKTLTPLSLVPVPLQPCLRDIWHDHLLFTENRLTGLIDPGACRTDHVAADISRLLGSLLGDQTTTWKQALDEYHSHRPLGINDWQLVSAYHQSGIILGGITWLEWLILDGKRFYDRALVERRLQLVLNRLKYAASK